MARNSKKSKKVKKTSKSSGTSNDNEFNEEDTELLEIEPDSDFSNKLVDVDQMQKDRVDKQRIKIKDSDALKVAESVLDVETRTTLYNLRRRKYIDYMTGVISTGKEANVYHAYSPEGDELAVKIYRTSTNIFKGL